MASLTCPSCNHNNDDDAHFCQKCGTRLFSLCAKCGSENDLSAEFCKKCGVKLSEAEFALSPEAVARWRAVLGGINGWSPSFTPEPDTLKLWNQLEPALDPENEPLLFEVTMINQRAGKPPVALASVTASGLTIRSYNFMFRSADWAYLLATDFRLLAYSPKLMESIHVPYGSITAAGWSKDHFILDLKEGWQVDMHFYISRSGIMGAIAVLGAPPEAKVHAVDFEQRIERRADEFHSLFNRFFDEIIAETKQRK